MRLQLGDFDYQDGKYLCLIHGTPLLMRKVGNDLWACGRGDVLYVAPPIGWREATKQFLKKNTYVVCVVGGAIGAIVIKRLTGG